MEPKPKVFLRGCRTTSYSTILDVYKRQIQDYNKADRTQEINKGFEDFIKGITTQYRLQTQEIERQIDVYKRQIESNLEEGVEALLMTNHIIEAALKAGLNPRACLLYTSRCV